MLCASTFTTFTCSVTNALPDKCTKVLVTVPVIDGEPPCNTSQYALMTVAEVESLTGTNPFNLDIESAVAIGGAILLVMAVAYVLRMTRKALETESDGDS